MFLYFQTTMLILFMVLLFSIFLTFILFELRYHKKYVPDLIFTIFPVLVVGPIFLVLGFKVFKTNLLFPISVISDSVDLLFASIIPSLVLLSASGLFSQLNKKITFEIVYWSQKKFFVAARGFGLPEKKSIQKIVIMRSFTSAWQQCLPWVFAELIIVECVFNAPGLGYSAWNFAKVRDLSQLINALAMICLFYFVCAGSVLVLNRWLGKRLETYE